MSSLLAIGWEPELRGVLTVIIGVGVLCGSVYLILGTNLGARLGFLISFAALAGWMLIMGITWMIYGIGMQGPLPTWQAVPGRTVLSDVGALVQGDILNEVEAVPDATPGEQAGVVADAFHAEGWITLDPASAAYGQAVASAQTLIEGQGVYETGTYGAIAVYDIGGERYPKINESLDFIAFRHKPHYVVVEFAPYEPTRTEPGRAPASNILDSTQPHQYVYMVRDLGARRQPAAALTVGSGLIFVASCYLLHRRDATVSRNRSAPAVAAAD